ncbi:MAG: TonB-dependent receptor plug domain-containing protein [Acidobacteria bacterium]|nr:TonB-dependent receptor plug domain-containing protein [Acidobacteriota bacterium]
MLVAQSADTAILGLVTDATGAAVPGAAVTIRQPETGFERILETNAEGSYELRYLRPATYTVDAGAAGFRTSHTPNVVVQVGQQVRLDFRLEIGDVVETVEVTSASPLLETESATLGEVVSRERIVNLPLNGRNFLQLATMTPGVIIKEESNGERTRIVAAGNRDVWAQVNINGITAVNNRSPFVNFYPSIDAVQEFKVQSGNYSAEYGGQSGANVNVQLRSGSNDFHGSLFDFLRNDNLDARGYFRPKPLEKDVLRRNQFGAIIAGPVIKNKTFFMGGYEGVRDTKQHAQTSIVVPEAQRRGDFSGVSTAVIDPFSGQQFANNVIPQSRLNPVSVNLINNWMPLPNSPGVQNYAGLTGDKVIIDQYLTRLDHNFTDTDQFTFHYIYSSRDFPAVSLNPYFSSDNRTFPNQSLGAQYVKTISASMVNELRFGFHKGNIRRLNPRSNTDFRIEDLGIYNFLQGGPNGRPLRPDEQGFPTLNITGYLGMQELAASSNLDNSRTYQWVDNLSIFRGKHSIKIGGDVRLHKDEATTNNWPFGSMTFTSDIANNAAAAYMLGFPREVLTPEGVPLSNVSQWRTGLYFQDDWKATQKLTLNMGLRYDLFGLPKETNGVTRTLRFDVPGPLRLFPETPGTFEQPYVNQYNYLGPRFGFAYRFDEKTVIRGGYGIFRTAGQFDNMNILQLNPPAGGSVTVLNTATNPVATIDNPAPAEIFPENPFFNVVSVPPDRKRRNAYIQNMSFQVQRQLTRNDVLEVGWVANKGTDIDTSVRNFNQPDPGPGAVQDRRPYPEFATIRMMLSDGLSTYHSLQSRYERRLTNGLSLTAAYTWGHMIDDIHETINRGGCGCQSARNRGTAERANSVEDIRHRAVIGYVWEILPNKQWSGISKAVLGGWQFGGLLTLSSGQPFPVNQSGDSQNKGGQEASRPHNFGVNPTLDNPDPALWFDTTAFVRSSYEGGPGLYVPGSGGYGTAPRNPVVGPGVHTWDLQLGKNFAMPYNENHRIQFRTEMFNTFNTPQFANPGGTLGTGSFGRVTSMREVNANRQIQFGLKYLF